MALSAGTRLGPYEILEPLGAGGMGEVYRARDTRLDRTVAVKVLPSELSASSMLRQRLEREAKVVSSLSHPHICALHDVGREGETDFLVMEYLEGETLAHRLEKGPLPLGQALRTASEIADALDKAHRQGVVHRDLKPGNVMLTKTGAKLLDFGLAKLRDAGPTECIGAESALPTQERPLTEEGKIVGTYPYMAPEQLEGKEADARTDLFAFGAVLYEMVTGQRAFQGESRASLIAAIMSSQPRPISELQPMTPPMLDRVVRRCLEKDPDERWQSAGDLAAELRWIGDGLREAADVSRPSARLWKRQHVAWALSVATAAALGILVSSWWGASQRPDGPVSISRPAPVSHTVIDLPPDAPLALGGAVPTIGFESSAIALSPDGSQLAYVGDSGEGRKLYLRPMDSYEADPIVGTEGAVHPFFSPDGRWLGFLTTDKVKRVSLRGGAPLTVCDARTPVRATWTRDDTIYFAENQGMILSRVPAGGGEPKRVVQSKPGASWALLGQVLPDGGWVLATSGAGLSYDYGDVLLVSLETRETRLLIESGYDARYVPSGHLLFARSGNVLAVPFDIERLQVSGEPIPVLHDVSMDSFFAQMHIDVSKTGSLVYVPGRDYAIGKLAWVDRKGAGFLPVVERLYGAVDLAPGGRRLAVHVADVNDYIWTYDFDRAEGRKLTVAGAAGWPLWTPDASSITFSSWGSGDWKILRRVVDHEGAPEELFASAGYTDASSWSPDGEVLALWETVQGGYRLNYVRMDERPGPEWSMAGGSESWGFVFSPDGRWVAYASDQTGRFEIWVRSYPDGGTVRQISAEGGVEPLWCEGCDELFYRKGNQWLSSAVRLEPELTWEPPRLAFETDFIDTPGRSYDVSPDGQRLLVVKSTREPTRTKLHVIHNWFEELKAKMGDASPVEEQASP